MWWRNTSRWKSSFIIIHSVSFTGCTLRSCTRYVSQGQHFRVACEGLQTTPSGKNPYDVLNLQLTSSLTKQDIAKQYRDLVVQCHPDKPGGSTEKMTEVNLAYKILKEHHDNVLRQLQRVESAQEECANNRNRFGRGSRDNVPGRDSGGNNAEEFARRARRHAPFTSHTSSPGGSSSSASASRRPRRCLQELITQWEMLTQETEAAVRSTCSRYEVALQQGKFLREGSAMNEITARERWIRKSFIKSMWETVHELRGELLHRGARSAQQSELAENMVIFASQIQRKLNEDFQRQTQGSIQFQTRMLAERALKLVVSLIGLVKMWDWIFGGRRKKGRLPVQELEHI